jgi:hypothetical protein
MDLGFAWTKATISKIDLVPSVISKVEVIKTKKSFHGKTLTHKSHKTVNKPSLELAKNPQFTAYTKRLKQLLEQAFSSHFKQNTKKKGTKEKILPLSGLTIKLQIQANGGYDLLYIGTANSLVEKTCNDVFTSINALEALPKSIEQGEIQVKISLTFK